ncbi:DUF1127 domain-containing protein [Pseudomonas sp. D2-3]
MHSIRNIRWIDLTPGPTLNPSLQEEDKMDHQAGVEPTSQRQPWRFIGWLKKHAARVRRWQHLAYERQLLASLSDAALKDLGLSRSEVFRETQRPFWDDPLSK